MGLIWKEESNVGTKSAQNVRTQGGGLSEVEGHTKGGSGVGVGEDYVLMKVDRFRGKTTPSLEVVRPLGKGLRSIAEARLVGEGDKTSAAAEDATDGTHATEGKKVAEAPASATKRRKRKRKQKSAS